MKIYSSVTTELPYLPKQLLSNLFTNIVSVFYTLIRNHLDFLAGILSL